jgi:hypothetical protein
MMIRHVVLIKFKPEITKEQQNAFCRQMGEDLGKIPDLNNLCVGSISDQPAYDAALFIDFSDEGALKAYADHPLHKAAAAQLPAMCGNIMVLDCALM